VKENVAPSFAQSACVFLVNVPWVFIFMASPMTWELYPRILPMASVSSNAIPCLVPTECSAIAVHWCPYLLFLMCSEILMT
jgi:hypothetical protein